MRENDGMTIVVGYRLDQFGEVALEHGITRARATSSPLVLVSVAREDGRPALKADELENLRAEIRDKTGTEVSIRQPSGDDTSEEILTVAREVKAGLIIIGLRPRTAVGKLLMGSTAQRILMDAPVPVLAVKPGQAAAAVL